MTVVIRGGQLPVNPKTCRVRRVIVTQFVSVGMLDISNSRELYFLFQQKFGTVIGRFKNPMAQPPTYLSGEQAIRRGCGRSRRKFARILRTPYWIYLQATRME